MRTKKQVRISEIVIPKYIPVFNNKTYKHIILTSGRAGTKSSFAAIRTDYQIVADAHGSAVVLRKHHNKLRKTVYKEMLRGINRLQIPKNRFYITKSPMEITYKKYNTTIYFSGSDGIDDTKGIIDEDKPIKLVILDELTEFDKTAIEILRQPLEEREIRLTRARGNICYPADFLMLASMNPCNCGYYPNMQKCRCTQASLKRHFDKISQPLIDRMDLCVEAPMVSFAELMKKGKNESSAQIQGRVNACHQIQMKRFAQEKFHHNSRIPASRLSEFCSLGKTEKTYMEKIYAKMSLSARTYHKILRIARTIADMREADTIGIMDLQEAVCYRSIDEKFWGGV